MSFGQFPPYNDPSDTQREHNQFRAPGQFDPPPYYQYPPQINPRRKQQSILKWYRSRPLIVRVAILFGLVCYLTIVIPLGAAMLYVAATSAPSGSTYQSSQPGKTTVPDTPTPTSTPTLQQVVQNSGQYDCCLADGAANVSDLEATETSDGSVLVLARVVNLSWPANPVDVGKVLIFQYMAAVWTSSYHPQSVTVTVMYQGTHAGVMRAELTQETEQGTDWSKTNPFDYWNVYDATDISPSLS